MYHVLFIQSLLEGHLGCFHFSATVNSNAMNIPVQIFVCTPVSNSFGSSNTFWSLFFPCWSAVPLLVDTEFPHVCGSLSMLLILSPWSNNPSWHQPYTVRVMLKLSSTYLWLFFLPPRDFCTWLCLGHSPSSLHLANSSFSWSQGPLHPVFIPQSPDHNGPAIIDWVGLGLVSGLQTPPGL